MLSEKIQLLRGLEGNLRGMHRALTKSELARLIGEELGETISQAYLSQLESGKREHMTAKTRDLLARFFKVHPGFLVDDPEGYRVELSTAHLLERRLDGWLEAAAQDLELQDPDVSAALHELAGHESTRQVMLLLARLIRHPDLLAKISAAAMFDAGAPVRIDDAVNRNGGKSIAAASRKRSSTK